MGEIAKHTPGPWRVPTGPFISGLSVETRAIDAFIECPGSGGSMSLTTTICTLEWSGTPEWEANARLIAEAPTMLEALQKIAAGDGVYGAQAHEYKQIAREAIAAFAPSQTQPE